MLLFCTNTGLDSVIRVESSIEESFHSFLTAKCQRSHQTDATTEFERMIAFQQSPLDILLETFMDKFSRAKVVLFITF